MAIKSYCLRIQSKDDARSVRWLDDPDKNERMNLALEELAARATLHEWNDSKWQLTDNDGALLLPRLQAVAEAFMRYGFKSLVNAVGVPSLYSFYFITPFDNPGTKPDTSQFSSIWLADGLLIQSCSSVVVEVTKGVALFTPDRVMTTDPLQFVDGRLMWKEKA